MVMQSLTISVRLFQDEFYRSYRQNSTDAGINSHGFTDKYKIFFKICNYGMQVYHFGIVKLQARPNNIF